MLKIFNSKAGSNLPKNLNVNRKTLVFCALMFLSLGCVPAYFDFMVCAISLWITGCAIMNIFVFEISFRKT